MKQTIVIKDEEIAKILQMKMGTQDMYRALSDSGQVIMNSTAVGFVKRISPDGKAWAPNSPAYKAMKGDAAPLTGPTSATIPPTHWTGRAGYKFAKINPIRMKNTLQKLINAFAGSVTIKYSSDAQKRADITQRGLRSVLKLVSTIEGRKPIEFKFKVAKRPHLGVSNTYSRMGGLTDPQHIEKIFGDMVGKSMK